MAEVSPLNQAIITSFYQLLSQVPTFLVLIGGIIAFLLTVRRSVVANALAASSFGLIAIDRVARTFVANALIMKQQQLGWPVTRLSQFLSMSAVGFGLLEAAAFGMLIGAVIVGRTRQEPPVK